MSWVTMPGGAQVPLTRVYQSPVAHPYIDPDTFNLDLIRYTALNGAEVFEIPHLGYTLFRVADKDMRSRLSNHQIQILQAPIPDCLNDDDALRVLVEQWFDIFNSAFFGKAFTGGNLRLVVTRGIAGPQGQQNDGRVAGIYSPTSRTIEVNLDADFVNLGFLGSIEHMHIATVLHEMVHAFFNLYGCKCPRCGMNWDAKSGGQGWGGHGPPWANGTHYTAESLATQTQWPININVNSSVNNEMISSGWIPTEAEAATWGLHWSPYWAPLIREQWRVYMPAQPLNPQQDIVRDALDQLLRSGMPRPQNPVNQVDHAAVVDDEDDDAIDARNQELMAKVIQWNQDHGVGCINNPVLGGQAGMNMRGPGDNGLAQENANTERMQRQMGGF